MKKIIFIVDDDKEFLQEMNEIMSETDYDAEFFNSGIHLMEKIKHIVPDLIVIDQKMEDMSGLKAAAVLNTAERTRNVPIFLISAYSNLDTTDEYKNLPNIKRFFKKPFDLTDFLNAIDSQLGGLSK